MRVGCVFAPRRYSKDEFVVPTQTGVARFGLSERIEQQAFIPAQAGIPLEMQWIPAFAGDDGTLIFWTNRPFQDGNQLAQRQGYSGE